MIKSLNPNLIRNETSGAAVTAVPDYIFYKTTQTPDPRDHFSSFQLILFQVQALLVLLVQALLVLLDTGTGTFSFAGTGVRQF